MTISNRLKAVTLILTIAGTVAFHPGADAEMTQEQAAAITGMVSLKL